MEPDKLQTIAHTFAMSLAGAVPSHIQFDEATCLGIVSKAWALAHAFASYTPPPPAAEPAVVDPAAPVVEEPAPETTI